MDRDVFAAFALQGMLAHATRYKPAHYTNVTEQPHWHEAIAEEAFNIADAMMAERAKRNHG
jgi:hypothetical protein